MTPNRRSLAELARIAGWILAVWSVNAVWSFIVEFHRRGALDAPLVLDIILSGWMYAIVTPFMLYVADRFSFRGPHLVRNVLAAFALMVPLTATPAILYTAIADRASIPTIREDLGQFLATSALTGAYAAFVIVVVANYLRTVRENFARQQAEAELDAKVVRAQLQQLRADLNPHFLFNSLNSVLALVRDEPREAERMLRILSDLLRRSFLWLDREITLREEMAFVAGYLEVQRMRYGDRLSVAMDVPPQLEHVLVPPLILQPLVENAVVHGVARLPQDGHVAVFARADADQLILTVRDSGPGFDPAHTRSSSIGVPNTRARLHLMYGDAQSLAFRRERDGFVAEIALPLAARAIKVPA